jgi:FAD/FMN-containing dehydrogenase
MGPTARPTLHTDDPVLIEFAELVGSSDPIAVAGGRTRWHLGGELDAGTRVISAPSGIVSYRPEEMTISVRAGTPVADLDAALAERGQRSALPSRGGTVGGALAVGQSDHRALGRGLLRTALLQVRYVSAEGRIVSSGGPTVKNVSGFDLPRLMVGSLGTLGLLAEVILRTNPVPAVSRWLRIEGAAPDEVARALLNPSVMLWDGTNMWVELEGHEPDVDAQTELARNLAGRDVSPVDASAVPELPTHRWSLPPSELLTLAAGSAHDTGAFVAAVGLGLVHAERPQPPRPMAPEIELVSGRLKQNFDPTGRLNPGRIPGRS